MFGKIIEINDNIVKVEKVKIEREINILNYHIIIEEENLKSVGEVITYNDLYIEILLFGEIKNNKFTVGLNRKPTFKSKIRIIYKSEAELLLGKQDYSQNDTLLIGNSNIYENFKVTTNMNDFFSNHFAIVGNTGSGKSCGVAKLLQNIFNFEYAPPINAHVVLFDVYGEYKSAFENLNSHPVLRFKSYTTQLDFPDSEVINIPPYFLETDDLALLLNATEATQLPIIDKALYYVYIFASKDEKVINYKNSIIANSILDILASGRTPVQIRDQIIAVLSQFNTEKLNLGSIIAQPGYNRTLKQCLNIDAQGKMNSVSFVVDYLETYLENSLEEIKIKNDISYSLNDLYQAFEFALISEGLLRSETIFDKLNVLKVRLKAIMDSPYSAYFNNNEFISKSDYVKELFQFEDKNAQIINMNFNYIDERFAKVLTKVYAKLFFNYATNLEIRTSFPIHILLEEAHRYVQNDSDIKTIGYNIFDRITKEGRKYGVLLGFITQRPSELSTTSLSQCSNFIAFRMFYPEDIKIISSISANVSEENIERIKTLSPGTCMVFGTAFKIPLIANMELPNPMPKSNSVDIVSNWYQNINKNYMIDIEEKITDKE